jgi:5-methylcytosine-specific restriction endonuclease McrA
MMWTAKALGVAIALTLIPGVSLADKYVKGYYRKDGTYVAPHYRKDSGSSYYGVDRNPDGSINRSESAKYQFKKSNPCPSTGSASGSCPGYVVDHVVPLKRGGSDSPNNMQWQTVEEAKAKDKWE